MTPREQFFYDQAGYSYDPASETEQQGRERCAVALALAETQAIDKGFVFVWDIDCDADPMDWDGEGPMGDTAYYCQCWNAEETSVLASLCGIFDPTPEYKRVVQAELAMEALGTWSLSI